MKNSEEQRLHEVIISGTNRCNLRCAMCQIPSSAQGRELNVAEMRRLVEDAISLCPRSIVFSGGEPLLREDIFDLITFVNTRKVNTCLTTNGTLVTDDVARKLAAAGVGVVNVSIDGNEEVHDALRGKGNFVKAVAALRHLAAHKIETTVAAIISRQNYVVLPQVIELAHQCGSTTVRFQPFSDIFLKDKSLAAQFFIPVVFRPELEKSIAEVIRLAKEYKISINPEGYLNSIAAYLCGESKVNPQQKGCSAIWSSCPVSAEGNVFPCWVLADRVVGNVKQQTILDIWGSQKHNRMRRDIEAKGCGGCMMSCYDHNFGQPNLEQLITLNVQKMGKGSFYRRMHNRIYQAARYGSKKLLNSVRVWILMRRRIRQDQHTALLGEIQDAQKALQKKRQEYR